MPAGRAAALAAALVLGAVPAAGASPDRDGSTPFRFDTLRLADAVRLAREANPMLRAERLQAARARERIGPAGAWPDPELGLGLVNRPLAGLGTGEMMTMNTVRLSQMVPWSGAPGHRRAAARADAVADSLAAVESEATLVARVKAAYYRLAALDRSVAVMRETLELLRGFEQVSAARYGVGEAIQQDVLQAQVGVARMEADVVMAEQERLAEAARLNALLAREPGAPVAALELPPPGPPLPPPDTLSARALAGRPALQAQDARIRSAAALAAAAGRERLPDLMVALEYGQRPQYDDMASLMVGFRLPVRPGLRQIPMRREMEAMRAREEAMAAELRNETWARIVELGATAERARRLERLYEARILPQARAAVESALAAYRVGAADFMTLVESQMAVSRYAIERIRLLAEYHTAAADIEALQGGAEALP